MIDYAKAHFSTKQSSSGQDTRIPHSDGDQERAARPEEAAREGSEAAYSGALLIESERLSPELRLRNSREFRRVYAEGKRYDGRLMTVFLLPNHLNHHRLGITASRKMARRAVDRNRSKRLLRETFRLSGSSLGQLRVKYDWVINAKRSLLTVKVAQPLEEFQGIAARIASEEREAATTGNEEKL